MAITITSGVQTVAVEQILGWDSSRPSATQVHTIIGRPDPDVSLGALGTRTGTLSVLCSTLAEAAKLESYLGTQGVHTLTDTEVPEVGMIFVVVDRVDVSLDIESAVFATVAFGFQEVIP